MRTPIRQQKSILDNLAFFIQPGIRDLAGWQEWKGLQDGLYPGEIPSSHGSGMLVCEQKATVAAKGQTDVSGGSSKRELAVRLKRDSVQQDDFFALHPGDVIPGWTHGQSLLRDLPAFTDA